MYEGTWIFECTAMDNGGIKNCCTSYITEIIVVILVSLFIHKIYLRKKSSLPPGPRGLPLVGYLPFYGSEPHLQFLELSKKYGPVIGVPVGSVNLVVMNTFESFEEGYRAEAINARMPGTLYQFSDIPCFAEVHHEAWKVPRRNFINFLYQILKTEGGIINLQDTIIDETDNLLNALANLKDKSSVNLKDLFHEAITNTSMKCFFSHALPVGHPIFKALETQLHRLLNQMSPKYLTTCFPKLRWILRRVMPSQRLLKKATKEVETFIHDEIQKHREVLDPQYVKDFIDYSLLNHRLETGSLNFDKQLNNDIQIILAGGSDTMRISMEWLFLLMAKFQDVQERVYKEIEEVCGVDHKVRWEDRYLLPYTLATVFEAQRWKTILPLGPTRWALEDVTVMGHLIPKGSIVTSNIWAIHNDETYWKDPSVFRPDRFLDQQGKYVADKRLLAFSYGKRDCPGKNLALMTLFSFLLIVISKYKVVPTKEGLSLENNTNIAINALIPVVAFQSR